MRNLGRALVLMSVFGLGLALIGGASPRTAEAAALTAYANDPTNHEVYLQFSTDVPFDAFRMVVREPGVGFVAKSGGHPHGAMGASGVVTGLNSDTNYRLILKVRWVHGGPFVIVDNRPFKTNP